MSESRLTKRIFASLLAFCILFSMLDTGFMAYAADDNAVIVETDDEDDGTIPDEGWNDEEKPEIIETVVSTPEELEEALAGEYNKIEILSDLVVDRTFYITKYTVIFSQEDITLTRDPSFAGDMFVLGPSENTDEPVTITFGSGDAKIIIDGNKSNVTVDVVGSIFFVRNSAEVELRGVTVTNAKKVGNEILLDDDKYDVSYKSQVGGAAVILTSGKLDIYDSEFTNNEVSIFEEDTTDSLSGRGAAIYSFGKLNVYNSKFINNCATKGGAIYNYRETLLNDTVFEGNTASTLGGAIYVPASVSASVYTDNVTFKNNTAESGGALHSSGTLSLKNTIFTENEATNGSGGAIYTIGKKTADKKTIEAENVTFTDNIASDHGGALYITPSSSKDAENNTIKTGSETFFSGATFSGNKANGGHGGAIWMTGGDETDIKTIELYNATFGENQACNNGGAIYFGSKSNAYAENTKFIKNEALAENGTKYGGGAVYSTGSTIVMNDVEFTENKSGFMGGAFEIHSSTVATLNNVIATDNIAENSTGGAFEIQSSSSISMNNVTASGNQALNNRGGFMDVKNAQAKIWNSVIENSSANIGGAIAFQEGSGGGVYNTEFKNNVSTSHGAAMHIYTNGEKVTLHTVKFNNNSSSGYGGAVYASKSSIIDMYNISATGNSAVSGGFMYETTTGTVVNLNGLTVAGNTADNGPIIYGNSEGAKLNINKTNYFDESVETELDEAYWSGAIVNKLTVTNLISLIPGYRDFGEEGTDDVTDPVEIAVGVMNISELKLALDNDYSNIQILKGFNIDRTFEITNNTNIYAKNDVTLTRDPSFAGDMFVLGPSENTDEPVTITFGSGDAKIIIDGNKSNVTVDVVGSIFFVRNSAEVELRGVTVTNAKKVGNEILLDDKYDVSYKSQVGGAAVILTSGKLDIYDSEFTNNEVNIFEEDTTDSLSGRGAAIYSFGKLNVYNSKFINNCATKGGAIYNYRETHLNDTIIEGNTASTFGGAIYIPSSVSAFLYTDNVSFIRNTAESGGAIHSSGTLSLKNTTFTENEATNGSGGAIYTIGKKSADKKTIEAENVTFTDNTASDHGGALYITPLSSKDAENNTIKTGSETLFSGATFSGNKANGGHGGAIWMTGGDETDIKTIELYNATFGENQADYNGGAIYFGSKSNAYLEDVIFTKNKALAASDTRYGGGAIYGTGVTLEINGAKFIQNVSDYYGGAIEFHSSSNVTLNDITAEENSANLAGGFLFAKGSTFKLYNSYIKNNTAKESGGAMFIRESAEGEIHKTDFISNTAVTKNGGALYIYTNGGVVTLNKVLLNGNTAVGNGGAVYASGKSVINMYNIEAVENSSACGGFMYETVTGSGTVVNLNGLTVDGNVAPKGPIIFGGTTGATLNINKSSYIDRAVTGELDAAYWSGAIANKLTINDLSDEIPNPGDYGNESTDAIGEYIDVRTLDELEAALCGEDKNIRITSNILVDRTLYVIGEKLLFTTTKKSIKRAPAFGGDMFVVGEDKDGNYPLTDGIETVFTLGNPGSDTENLLIIDGNRDNITCEVSGSAMFVAGCAKVNFYKNVSVVDHYKNANDRVFDNKYGVNSAERTGGSAIVNIDGNITIYGGLFNNNKCEPGKMLKEDGTETDTLINGGAIHNRGTISIHDGTFSGNEGTLGGIMYNLKRVDILGGKFIENHALKNGGAIYMAAVQYAHLYVGKNEGAGVSAKVLFKNNVADSTGGALFNASMSAVIINGDTTFEDNFAGQSGGAVATYGTTNIKNTIFTNNKAKTRGGALYLSNPNNDTTTRIVNVSNSIFEGNESTVGGAIVVFSSSSTFDEGGIIEIDSCKFIRNKAINLSDKETQTDIFGGAIYNTRKGSAKISNSVFTENTAEYEGGVVYAAGESETIISQSVIKNNSVINEKSRGGVLSVHSATVEFNGVTFDGNSSRTNGGALYISYTTSSEVDSTVKVNDSAFINNSSGLHGGAIYATKHIADNDKLVLTIKNTDFTGNSSYESGGAVYLTAKVDSYMKNVDFVGNKAGSDDKKVYGGAIYMNSGSSLELDTATFSHNEVSYCGGGIAVHSFSDITINNVTTDGNKSNGSAGFLYGNNANILIYDSVIRNNTSNANGGAVSLYNASTVSAYGVSFDGNKAVGIGGAIANFSYYTVTMLHSCEFNNNEAGTYGGAVYLTNEAIVNMYNCEAVGNKADKGGFFYETMTGSEATIRNLTVEGNTATTDGDIIYGNSYGATLYIDKFNFEDRASDNESDDAYWDYAIKNMLTVVDISGSDEEIPERLEYVEKEEETEKEEVRPLVPVEDVLSLGLNSSDDAINSTYGKLPRLDNSSNFMSNNTTLFEDINGETVSVDTFVYQSNHTEGNVNFGMGMMIYQAILYKDAHPEEDVKVSIAHFRFEMETALCINRNSRYFGYMRNLVGADYDKYGFVRISYLLVTAAKMGIEVTVMGQIPGYPHSSRDPDFIGYFEKHLKDPCDPAYVEEGKLVGDYMNFAPCEWTSYGDKGGSDMMHLKMATASHYLDMNGVEHKNALFTSTSNLDGINSNATNGNSKVQAGVLVSDHEGLYRTAANYMNLLAEYRGQEEVYTFRSVLADKTAEQFELILSGRADEIPSDEQIVYLGTEDDDVFELYFTPFGGSPNEWTEKYNPYCKYVKKLADSEDYILLMWNNANYLRAGLVAQIEDMIISAFHNNKNPNNKIYVNLAEFDKSAFDDLKVGVDIGLKNFNKKEFGALHTKDLQLSYVENGQRQYVTLFNTLNFHSGAISYQSNSVLVVKETDGREGSVFFALADNTTNGVVEHTYSIEKVYLPENGDDGYRYKQCEYCDRTIILDTVHRSTDWIMAAESTDSTNGIAYKKCINCDKILNAKEIADENLEIALDYTKANDGFKLSSANDSYSLEEPLAQSPKTFEVSFYLPKSIKQRAGVLIGNYDNTAAEQINVEIYTNGLPRLYYKANKKAYTYLFTTDVRSDSGTHLAITIDGLSATLYLNGVATETITLGAEFSNATMNFKIGADNRESGSPYFNGVIHSVAIFDDARTADEVALDMIMVPGNADGLLYSKRFIDVYEGMDNIFINNASYDGSVWSCDLTLHSVEPVSGDVYVAVYEDEVFKKVVSYTAAENLPVSVDCADGQTIKILWWDSEFSPYSRMFEIDVRNDEVLPTE